MWILRFHLLQPKDYNKIDRICKKYGFVSRTHSPIIYSKASIKYATQKHSWRSLSGEFHIDHAALAKFFTSAKDSGLLQEIFHIFLERRIALYIGEKRSISGEQLDNSQEIFELTQAEILTILSRL